ncbi:MAG: hypothetical protein CL944_00055 [Candidatus Diapherotrites archaeon]|uniref:Uncharacterized protein n=1 Tax=Candidatus Iainarchaeum sp. TaxID=3101447 RepID=A0A2D6LNU1_9ARCH|nr:hypothetical protein [Candidatus Diapherotrites archaeon]|tara:strand:- start:21432 stop:22112 length:681 start_codon:yes stop_codon:yes gene_type:complete
MAPFKPRENFTARNQRIFKDEEAAIMEGRAYIGLICPGKDLLRFGRKFLLSFPEQIVRGKKRTRYVIGLSKGVNESNFVVGLRLESQTGERERNLGSVSLGFDKDSVIMIPNGHFGEQPMLDRFKHITEKPWANYLVELIEEHARKNGFQQVKIPVPESLYYYKNPVNVDSERETEQVRRRMRTFYGNVARAMHYERKESKNLVRWLQKLAKGNPETKATYFVKKL